MTTVPRMQWEEATRLLLQIRIPLYPVRLKEAKRLLLGDVLTIHATQVSFPVGLNKLM
jgi:hypothetical protein